MSLGDPKIRLQSTICRSRGSREVILKNLLVSGWAVLVDGHKGVRVEDHQGKEVANEVFSQAWLAAESMSNFKVFRLTLVFIN